MLIDLSHTIEHGLVTYKGLPAPVICDYLSREQSKQFYEEGTTFQIGQIEMVANTGTYIDCPFHRFADGKDLAETGLESVAELEGVLVHAPYSLCSAISADYFKDVKVRGCAVLIYTGWDRFWNTESYYDNHPYLTREAAEYLRDAGAKLVGIDAHNIDDTQHNARPVHSILLGAGILIVEHLCNLAALSGREFVFSAVPPKIKGMGTFPVRAMAKVYANEAV